MGVPIVIANGRFKISKKIGEGESTEVYSAMDEKTSKWIAVKFQHSLLNSQKMVREHKMYKMFQSGPGIPSISYFGKEREYAVLAMDLLSKSLQNWFEACGNVFSIKTVCMIALQNFETIKFMHNKKYVHRDLKPENFMTGVGNNIGKIYLVNFNTVAAYQDIDGKHKPFKRLKNLIGTARFASLNLHMGNELSRRDDMETLGYMFCYFLRGSLPWQGIHAPTTKQRFEKISLMKQQTKLQDLCKGLPPEIFLYLKYARGLKFEETPDYAHCSQLITNIMTAYGYRNDGEFDWILLQRKHLGPTKYATVL